MRVGGLVCGLAFEGFAAGIRAHPGDMNDVLARRIVFEYHLIENELRVVPNPVHYRRLLGILVGVEVCRTPIGRSDVLGVGDSMRYLIRFRRAIPRCNEHRPAELPYRLKDLRAERHEGLKAIIGNRTIALEFPSLEVR